MGRRAIVAFPNFGHWRVRLSMLTTGRAPKTRFFPYDWYDSNIHFLTVDDFEQLARQEGLAVERRFFLAGRRTVAWLTNLQAEVAVYLSRHGWRRRLACVLHCRWFIGAVCRERGRCPPCQHGGRLVGNI